ncbi:hypothetical protein [Streptomyces sp. NPDC058869]|uniref:hypothetical protein n=1 Tax=Streptomyces sp. NPDC058869 TaxID=3346659 RepID=UPI0036A773F5
MNIVASIFSRSNNSAEVTAYTTRVAAGSLIGHVVERDGLFYFLNDEKTELYGKGERVSSAMKLRTRARIAARRHFGPDVVVA